MTWNPADPAGTAAADAFGRKIAGWAPAWERASCAAGLGAFVAGDQTGRSTHLVFATPPDVDTQPARDGGEDGDRAVRFAPTGVVFGDLFDRANAPVAALDAASDHGVAASRGGLLLEAFWGSWVLILRTQTGGLGLRAPGGSLRCFHLRRRDVDVWFSDIEDAARLIPERFQLDLTAVAAGLLDPLAVSNATGLAGVSELLGGQRLTVDRDGPRWDWPWRPAAAWRAERLRDATSASAAVRGAVQGAVDAWAGRHERILHRLSGGLDSSIVLGCLKRAPSRPEIVALTYFMPPDVFGLQAAAASAAASASGDERRYARLAATSADVALLERERRPAGVDLRGLLAARRTARPTGLAFSLDLDRMDVDAIGETRADAVFTGRGGDGIFFASTRPWGAIDAAWERELGPRLARLILRPDAKATQSAWSALGVVLAHGLLRRPIPPPPRPAALTSIISADAVAAAAADSAPPWTALGAGLPPGKREQLHSIVLGYRYSEPFDRGHAAAVIDPLQSQPVIEACLRIPSAVLLEGGSRGLARATFADLLPEAIRVRTDKAAGDSFIALIVRANAGFIRELLLDGELARRGVLDRAALEDAFALHAARGGLSDTLLRLVGAEAWARGWSDTAARSDP